LRVVKKIREEVGEDYVVGFRISADEHIELFDPELQGLGINREVSVKIARTLQKAGVDYIHVSAGIRETFEFMTPPMYISSGVNVPLAEEIKKSVDIPVMVAGGINTPELAEEIVRNNKADIISIARGLIADPYFVRKIREKRRKEIRICIRCNECTGRAHGGKSVKCTVNPAVGKEGEIVPTLLREKKTIFVVGGGPAGMQAAISLSEYGYYVVLFEKEEFLGGKLIPASIPKFKSELKEFREYLVSEVERKGIEVHTGVSVDFKLIRENSPDVTIIATGSIPIVPDVPGIEGDKVLLAEESLVNSQRIAGTKVAVVGGGKVGCEVALFLALKGKKVTIIEMCKEILRDEIVRDNKVSILRMLREKEVRILTDSKLVGIKNEGIPVVEINKNRQEISADCVILACGYKSNNGLFYSLLDKGVHSIYKIGDANDGRKIYDAIHQASSLVNLLAQ